jgi:DHA1 family tetracycline resistance protein-like MFS transporter
MLAGIGAIQLLVGIGGSAIVPLLPTYLATHGSGPSSIGLVMGSFYFAMLASQYPSGRLVDVIGPRRVVAVGLGLFVAGCVGFAVVSNPSVGVGFRALQGIGDGAVSVASAAAIGIAVPIDERARAFALFGASTMLSFAIGPIVGGAVGSASISALFLGAGGVGVLACGALPWLPRRLATHAQERSHSEDRQIGPGRFIVGAAALGASLAFAAVGLIGGLYDSVWSLLLRSRGVSNLGIGLSWTLYCLPYAVASPFAGRAVRRHGRRALALIGIVSSAVFASIYPQIHRGSVLIFLGAAEALTAVCVLPSAQAILSEHATSTQQGRAQGFVGSMRAGAMAVGAYGAGALYQVRPWSAFVGASVVLTVIAIAMTVTWRKVPGRTGDGRTPSGSGPEGLVAPTALG